MKRGPSDPYRFDPTELHPSVREKILKTDVFSYRDAYYEFGVVDPRVAPVHFAVGMPNGQNMFASSAIPPYILPLYLEHEIQCNRLRAGEVGRCASIEEQVIQRADPAILRQLLEARQRTFEDLITHYKIDVQNPADPFTKEIAGTMLYLREQMKKLNVTAL